MEIVINPDFDLRYDIRLAVKDDISEIMSFLGKYWRKDHVMAVNRQLFEYEYVHDDEVDFVIAVDKVSNSIEGVFGFLRCTRERTGDIWGSMWKVSDNPDNMKMLGIELAKRVFPLTGCKSHIGSGANPNTTVPLRKIFFRDKTARMRQFYMLNPNIKEFRIAKINNLWMPEKVTGAPVYSIKSLKNYEELEYEYDINSSQGIPRKDSWYLKHRFFEHPVYKYDAFGIWNDEEKCSAVFFGRTVNAAGSKIYRIVDFIGDHAMLAGIFNGLMNFLTSQEYEYIDLLEFGMKDEYLTAAGFRERVGSDNIIPNYFEPFLRENVDIWVHYKQEGTTFFKADGDQDRPNLI